MEQNLSTVDYISAILHGDPAPLRRMYQQFFPLVRNLIQQNGGTEDDAKDVFQDAVMVIYEKAKHPDFQLTSQFGTFLYGISRNLWMNRRQKKSSGEVTIPDDAKYIADGLSDVDYSAFEQRRLYDKAFLKLGEDCQRLLLLYFQKEPMESIAKQMGYASEGYARRRKFLCKEHLTELVKRYPEYQELRNDT